MVVVKGMWQMAAKKRGRSDEPESEFQMKFELISRKPAPVLLWLVVGVGAIGSAPLLKFVDWLIARVG